MGALGEYPKEEMLRRLKGEVAKWEKADPTKPVQPALHLIAVVAQDPYQQGYKAVESLALTLQGKPNPDAGKMTVVPGMYLGADNPDAVKAWRKANGLK